MRQVLHKMFVEDAPLKALSFVLAVILFLVRSDWDASTPAYIKINYIEPPNLVVTSDLVHEARVVIRGPWSRASRFTEAELDPITIDLSHRGEGELRFTDDMVRLPPGLHVGSFNPSAEYIAYEPRVERTVPVQPVIEGEPTEGYRVGKVTVTPKTVRVAGAKTAVEAMHNAQTRHLRVTDLRSPVDQTVRLAPPQNKLVTLLDTPEIAVHIDIERTIVERTYSSVQISVIGTTHMEAIQLEPAVATVVLRGPGLALEHLKGTPEVVVDATTEDNKPPGIYRKRLQVVNLPPDIAAEIRPDWVHMTTSKPERPESRVPHK